MRLLVAAAARHDCWSSTGPNLTDGAQALTTTKWRLALKFSVAPFLESATGREIFQQSRTNVGFVFMAMSSSNLNSRYCRFVSCCRYIFHVPSANEKQPRMSLVDLMISTRCLDLTLSPSKSARSNSDDRDRPSAGFNSPALCLGVASYLRPDKVRFSVYYWCLVPDQLSFGWLWPSFWAFNKRAHTRSSD